MRRAWPTIAALGLCLALAPAKGDEASADLSLEAPVPLPPVIVQGERAKPPPLLKFYNNLNNLVHGPFLELRSGELIEAIVWRHKFLQEHPAESAIIAVNRMPRTGRVECATTVYTRNGRVYGSNQFLGTDYRFTDLTPADLGDPDKIVKLIEGIRGQMLDLTDAEMADFESGGNLTDIAGDGSITVTGAMHGSGDLMSTRVALAELSGDYSKMGYAQPGGGAPLNPFDGTPHAIVDRSYDALHDPEQAGVVPVGRRVMEISVSHAMTVGLANISGVTTAPTKEKTDVLVFDWDGVHYTYAPNLGTYGHPIPVDPLTRRPYLCIKDGDLLESIGFCAAYEKAHPGEQARLIAPKGGPYGAVFTREGTLHYFSPFFGQADIPARDHLTLRDQALLERLFGVLVQREQENLAANQRAAGAKVVPEALAGDDSGTQAVRAYITLIGDGVEAKLVTKTGYGSYTLSGRWRGTAFTRNF